MEVTSTAKLARLFFLVSFEGRDYVACRFYVQPAKREFVMESSYESIAERLLLHKMFLADPSKGRQFRADKEFFTYGFDDADLRQARFIDCSFENCTFHRAHLENAFLKNCSYRNCQFDGATFQNSIIATRSMENVNFPSATFDSVQICSSISGKPLHVSVGLGNAKFKGRSGITDLVGLAYVTDIEVDGNLTFSGCDLKSCNFGRLRHKSGRLRFEKCDLSRSIFNASHSSATNMLENIVFDACALANAEFIGATLPFMYISQKTDAKGIKFIGATLNDSEMIGVDLSGGLLNGCNMSRSVLSDSILKGCLRDSATNFTLVNFVGATWFNGEHCGLNSVGACAY